jgi:hypothetical protein
MRKVKKILKLLLQKERSSPERYVDYLRKKDAELGKGQQFLLLLIMY